MTLHTPHRRISSRTKQRCRVIKNFICNALGTSAQIENKIPSSFHQSISDLKQKINSIETQLEKVSKHCYDLTCLENNYTENQNKLTVKENLQKNDERSKNDLSAGETKILYKATSSRYKKSDESDNTSKGEIKNNKIMINDNHNGLDSQRTSKFISKKIEEIQQPRDVEYHHYKKLAARHLAQINYSAKDRQDINQTEYPTHKRKHSTKKHQEPPMVMKDKHSNLNKQEVLMSDDKHKKHRFKETSRRRHTELDQEYISDIIKKQYKPVKLFDRRQSDFSQFSAPVCRDREFSVRDNICHDNDLCSCCFDQCRKHGYKNIFSSDVSDMRSVCDTRLYSSKKRNRYKRIQNCNDQALKDYNNLEYYDLVPVKEKSSPKSRKKFAENHTVDYCNYKEVPPSPRTQRPRLNLKAKVYDECDEIINLKNCSPSQRNSKNRIPIESDDLSEIHSQNNKHNIKETKHKPTHLFDNVDFANESFDLINNDTPLISQNTDVSAQKTDKTLGEIKDLLQSFLTVIKKDSIHNENDVNVTKNNGSHSREFQDTSKFYTNAQPSFNNYTIGNAPPIVPVFPNTCCYPIMPVCPVNYLQNGYLFPNVSNTCNACTKTTKQPKRSVSTCNSKQNEGNTGKETQEFIKEIYEFVTQNPKSFQKKEYSETDTDHRTDKFKNLTTRSVGDSSIASKYNHNLEASTTRSISKSCEAIGSRRDSIKYHCSASYSDTVLERLSVEATHSSTEFEVSNKDQTRETKTNKLRDMLKPWKWGKKKKDVIEELSESESTIEVDIQRKRPPFRQNIMNYAMHSQEFHDPPPLDHRYPHNLPDYQNKQGYSRFDPRFPAYNDPRNDFSYPAYHRGNSPPPPCQNYDPKYHSIPQVPLCLKEIEVKSIGTQSERKMTLFKKLTQKVKTQRDVSQQYNIPPAKAKSGIFNWKNLQENAKKGTIGKDFTLKTQQQLAQGDTKLRNAVIKKLFYKRNPFSPRNLIVRTLLGKDPSSFGNPPKMYKPRLFL